MWLAEERCATKLLDLEFLTGIKAEGKKFANNIHKCTIIEGGT